MKTGILQTGSLRVRGDEGFTLLELLIVLVILGIFLGAFSLGTGSFPANGDLRLATREILSEIAFVRGEAAGTRSEQELVFNIDKNRLERKIKEKHSISGWSQDGKKVVVRLPRGVVLVDVRVEGRGKFQEGGVAIRFFPNGCVERTLVHLKNLRNDVYTIEVNPLTGQAVLYDTYVDQEEEM